MRYILLTFVLTLATSGCATLLDGTTQNVTFNSQPNGVKIVLNGTPLGVTPLTTQIERSDEIVILAQKDGYQDQKIALQTKVNTYFWGYIITGGFFGSTTDSLSGAMVEYSPNHVLRDVRT